jgi:hypothetical protein
VTTNDPVLERWRSEQERLKAEVSKAERRIKDSLERLGRINIAIEEYLALSETPRFSGPGAPDLIVKLLDAVAPRNYGDVDVLAALQANGWTTNSDDALNLVRTYLSRLYRAKRIRRVSKGRYASVIENVDDPTEVEPSNPSNSQPQEGGDLDDGDRVHHRHPAIADGMT